ncbi:RNA-directed DNA polymerase, eukaryota [Tanacetum coccineum]
MDIRVVDDSTVLLEGDENSKFLIDVLEAFGFGSVWCNWIRGILYSSKASILVNGSPTKEFSCYCGLKQGDPLAPYIFILVMESLYLSFSRMVEEDLFKGIQLPRSISISHIFYADDAMFIGEWSDNNLKGITNILNCFFLALGLQINVHKCQLLGVGVSNNVVQQAADSIRCSILNNQFQYLGVMVGDNMSRLKAWDDIILHIKSRLSKWKVKTLSIGGRLTLLKSVLDASPIYTMSIFTVPRGVLKALESIRNHFFNGADQSDNKLTWVINALYGSKVDSHQTHYSSNWCSILREVHKLKDKGFDFWYHIKKRTGDGADTSFWYDCWFGDIPFCVKYPRLFALELDKQVSVESKLLSSMESSFRRNVRGGIEQHMLEELTSTLETVSLSNSCDRWICDLTSDGVFRVNEVRNCIDDIFLPSQVIETRWVRFVPIKVNIFIWRARQDCLPTRVNLVRRGINVDSCVCPICSSGEDEINHILFRCDLAQQVLRRICRWWELDPSDWNTFQEWYAWFSSIRFSSKSKSLLEGTFFVAWWHIWRIRNRIIFEGVLPRRSEVFDDIIFCAFNWCNNRCRKVFSWEDWLKNPHHIFL